MERTDIMHAAAAPVAPARLTVSRLGFWSAILTALVTLASFAISINTPPLSGPGCTSGCFTYPYHDAASMVPHDYIWMYPATLIAPLFVVLVVCIHRYAPREKRMYGQIAMCFAVAYAVIITINYYIQIAAMQPSLVKGETEGLALFSQYNPHGVFIALEELGYLMMSLAFLFAAPALAGSTRLEKAVRWLFTISAGLGFAAYVVMSRMYGYDLEYRFEIVIISITWLTLIAGGAMLAVVFRRAGRPAAGS